MSSEAEDGETHDIETPDLQELEDLERGVAKAAYLGFSQSDAALLFDRSRPNLTQKIKEADNYFPGQRKDWRNWEDAPEIGLNDPEITVREVLNKDFPVLVGKLDQKTHKEIGDELDLKSSSIASRIRRLERDGFLSSEGASHAKDYFPGIKLVDRLLTRNRVNTGNSTFFDWHPNDFETYREDDETEPEGLAELEILDRLAFRMDQATESDDYRMPELDKLDPFQNQEKEVIDFDRDKVFSLLNSKRRRHVLRYLIDVKPDSISRGELAAKIAKMEKGGKSKQINSDERKRVYVGLYQTHLEKLDEADLIDYDERSGEVVPQNEIFILEEFLDDSFWDYSDKLIKEIDSVFPKHNVFDGMDGIIMPNPDNEDLVEAIRQRKQEELRPPEDAGEKEYVFYGQINGIPDEEISELLEIPIGELEKCTQELVDEDFLDETGEGCHPGEEFSNAVEEMLGSAWLDAVNLDDRIDLKGEDGPKSDIDSDINFELRDDHLAVYLLTSVNFSVSEIEEYTDLDSRSILELRDQLEPFWEVERGDSVEYSPNSLGYSLISPLLLHQYAFTYQNDETEYQEFEPEENSSEPLIVEILEDNGGEISQEELSEEIDQDSPGAIGDARNLGYDIVRKRNGEGSYVVEMRGTKSDLFNSTADSLRGSSLWQKVRMGHVSGKKLSADRLSLATSSREEDHASEVERVISDYDGEIEYDELARAMNGLSDKIRSGLAYLSEQGKIEFGEESVRFNGRENIEGLWSDYEG